MSIRFDHAIVACPDLEEAMRRYTALGFEVAAGGRHDKNGTHNAIVRLGLDYFELLSIFDESLALSSGPGRVALVEFMRAHGGDLIGFTLTTDDAAATAAQLRSAGLEVSGPAPASRTRPDGNVLRFHPLIVGGIAWRKPWPFFVQWETPEDVRLRWEPPGSHRNAITGIRALSLLGPDVEALRDLYGRAMGLAVSATTDRPGLGARGATVTLADGVRIELLEPAGSGPLRDRLAAVGTGVHGLELSSSDLRRTKDAFVAGGLPVHEAGGALVVDGAGAFLGPDLRVTEVRR